MSTALQHDPAEPPAPGVAAPLVPTRLPRVLVGGAAVVALLAIALVARSLLGLVVARPPVAVHEVQPGRFVREATATGSLKAVRATAVLAPRESNRPQTIAAVVADGSVVKAGDVVVRFDPYDAEREAADGRADLVAARGGVERARAEGEKTRRGLALDRDLAADQLDRSRTFEITDERLYSRHQVLEWGLDHALSEKRSTAAGRKLEVNDRLSDAKVSLGRIQVGQAELKVKQAEQSLRASTVAAPHDGLLVLERSWSGDIMQVGQTLWPGQKVAEIPDLSELEARVYVLEADAAGLKPGLEAEVTIEGSTDGPRAATVSKVQPVAQPKERASPVKYFEATLSFEKTDPDRMRPGQKVEAVVRLEEAENVLAVPRGAVFERDGRTVVYRQDGGRFVPVEVVVGRNSLSRVVVEKGLSAGDRIALRDPMAASARPGNGGEAKP